MSTIRSSIVNYLETQFLGPPLTEEHEFEIRADYMPYQDLLAGMIFPQQAERDAEELADNESSLGDDIDPLNLSFSYLTSSVGLSICVDNDEDELNIEVNAGIYEIQSDDQKDKVQKYYKRKKLQSKTIRADLKNNSIYSTLEGKANIDVRIFNKKNKKLVTISLINNSKCVTKNNKKIKPKQEDILSRVSMKITASKYGIQPYPKVFRSTYDDEEAEQRILYKDENIYGVGHSCSVDWVESNQKTASEVSINFLPRSITKGSKSEMIEYERSNATKLVFLANPKNSDLIIKELNEFLNPYISWISRVSKELIDLKNNELDFSSDAIDSLINKLNECITRLKEGIAFIEHDQKALKAFQLSNLAMLMQMMHEKKYNNSSESLGGYKFFEKDHNLVSDFNEINYLEESNENNRNNIDPRWRPFQLAYFLLTNESVVKSDSKHRETVDLIWFATGGGKTEAYLFVSAFLIFYNKLKKNDHQCPEIVMRYTLSLLTQDQFVRSTRFITACERIRRDNVEELGESKISIGLWIGGAGTPNVVGTDFGAHEVYKKLKEEKQPQCRSPFILGSCPWCGTNLVPFDKRDDSHYGFEVDEYNFLIKCPSLKCDFHDELPVQVIDEELYANPPTFLLGTIDKFAQFAHNPNAGNLICTENECVNLIIQDELHLISGPLGTITGVFEAAFDTMLSHHQHKPKYLAATATIRGAEKQIKQLFARKTFTFPPSGISHKDRFFSKINEDDPGREYMGIMSQGHTAVTTTVRIAAAALQSTEEIQGTLDELDGYKTLVVYHNAKKEKSKTLILAGDDIPKRIKVIAPENQERTLFNIDELSADISRIEAFNVKRKLELPCTDPLSLDLVSVTSMLSVGVDIQRLGLMQVTGQPRQTSEFIQATSRVGRSDNWPGLVLVNYIASNTRDRSHYEQFYSYINSVNRFVEPTSVTPGAEPALRRVLPTCFMILGRHLLPMNGVDQAGLFNRSDNLTQSVFASFEKRLHDADPTEKKLISRLINEHLDCWANVIQNNPGPTHWHPRGGQRGGNVSFLTKDFGDFLHNAEWEVLQSMRHVDSEIGVKLI